MSAPETPPAAFPWSHPVRLADLAARKTNRITLEPTPSALSALAEGLALLGLRKLRFAVELTPTGRRDWRLTGQLGATVVQACVVSGAPVTTRIEEPVQRQYLADMPEPEVDPGAEIEIPEDETQEPLPAVLDLGEVMAEALALALPLYPRAEGAVLSQTQFAPPGADPLTDEAAKPFAGLQALRDQLKKDE